MRVRLAAIGPDELAQIVTESWRMCVPKKVYGEYIASQPPLRPEPGARGAD